VNVKAPAPALSAAMRQVLMHGPPPERSLRDLPSHDTLMEYWSLHGAAITAAMPGRRPWFANRIEFVNVLRGTE